jgi:hypothetical protein
MEPSKPELTDDEKERASKRERQRRWRERTAAGKVDDEGEGDATDKPLGASVTVHLTDAECAALDMLAAGLYRDHPHDPAAGLVEKPVVYPGRPAAVRLLIAQFRGRTQVRRPAPRQACADFWRVECAFRKATKPNTKAEPPIPPWTRKRGK